jgi:hypothetical protein
VRFGRTPAPPAAAVAAVPIADDGSIPLIDFLGQGFELLRAIDLGHSLWRVEIAADLDTLANGQIVIVAAYTAEDIESCRPLMQRFMTIVLAMGLGPRLGSRALALGAVGYVDASTDEGTIRGLFGDAVARVRIRRLRAAAA